MTAIPDWTLRPGVLLRSALDERGWTARDLADRAGLLPEVVEGILSGMRDVDEPAARGIGGALRTSAKMWLDAQRQYDEETARGAKDVSEERS